MGGRQGVGRGPVEELAAAHGADAWRLAVVAGADPAAATRAALHALVVGAVDGGAAAERAGVLALTRSWALSSVSTDRAARAGDEPAVNAFWSLSEPLRSTLWCADALRLPAEDVERVLGRAGGRPGAARGRLRQTACRRRREEVAPGSACAVMAALLGPVLAGHAAGTKLARVEGHALDCEECARLLVALRDPVAAVAASLPLAPDLGAPAARAWRTHVGAPNSTLPEQVRGAASTVSRHRRPVVAALVLATVGTFGSATGLLAASSERSAPQAPAPVAAPASTPAPRPRPAPVVRRQAVIPPLTAEAVLDPVLRRWVTPELAEVTPVTTLPPPPPTTAPPAPAPASALFGEPPPAQDLSTRVDLSLPLPISLPLSIEVGPACSTLTIGPLRLTLPCKR